MSPQSAVGGPQVAGRRSQVAVLDYGMGNLRSVEKAIERVGVEVMITSDADAAAGADGLVLPGVGAFPKAMARIRELGLDRLIADRLAAGTPVLGICLGFQLVFERSSELDGAEGLGLVAGEVDGLRAPGLKVPHIGWEPVRWERVRAHRGDRRRDAVLLRALLRAPPGRPGDVLGTAEHGERFACAIARPPLYGVQFHPEKSSGAGLRLLRNFAAICARAAASQPA